MKENSFLCGLVLACASYLPIHGDIITDRLEMSRPHQIRALKSIKEKPNKKYAAPVLKVLERSLSTHGLTLKQKENYNIENLIVNILDKFDDKNLWREAAHLYGKYLTANLDHYDFNVRNNANTLLCKLIIQDHEASTIIHSYVRKATSANDLETRRRAKQILEFEKEIGSIGWWIRDDLKKVTTNPFVWPSLAKSYKRMRDWISSYWVGRGQEEYGKLFEDIESLVPVSFSMLNRVWDVSYTYLQKLPTDKTPRTKKFIERKLKSVALEGSGWGYAILIDATERLVDMNSKYSYDAFLRLTNYSIPYAFYRGKIFKIAVRISKKTPEGLIDKLDKKVKKEEIRAHRVYLQKILEIVKTGVVSHGPT